MKYLKRLSVFSFVLLIVLSVLLVPSISAQEAEQGSETLDEKKASKADNDKRKKYAYKCDFSEIDKYYREYIDFFPRLAFEGKSFSEDHHLLKDMTCEELLEFIMEREKKRWSSLKIKQTTPKEGYTEPIIIAYGRYLKPPYKLEIDEKDLVFRINGVQIDPPNYYPSVGLGPAEKIDLQSIPIKHKIEKLEEQIEVIYRKDLDYYISIVKDIRGQ
ncbi:MAG: hypothetical protein GF329_08145, partial [Candidatus Lokiarchaeota archaeon]|nr:hypothetical protein [Candidatus Lokiarchaeota archaeon]